MKVAITGAGGYLGGMLVRAHAARGDAVHALARDAAAIPKAPGVMPTGVDLTRADDVPNAFFEHVDVVYHCAAEIEDESAMHSVNVDATRTLLSRARGRIGHWVQVSSLSVYGLPRAGVVTEESAIRPASRYAQTKAEADSLVADKSQGAFTYTIARPSAILGRNMRNRSLHALIETVSRGRYAFIGAPGAIGNFVHEDNVVDALLLCATRVEARARTYNVSQNCTIERMIETIASALGVAKPRMRIPEALARFIAQAGRVLPSFPLTPGRVAVLTSRAEYPTNRIERELGYRHLKSVEDGLRELVALHKEHSR